MLFITALTIFTFKNLSSPILQKNWISTHTKKHQVVWWKISIDDSISVIRAKIKYASRVHLGKYVPVLEVIIGKVHTWTLDAAFLVAKINVRATLNK